MAASLVALSAVPYFFFPREMPKEVGKGLQIPPFLLHTSTLLIHVRVPPSPSPSPAASVRNMTVDVVVMFTAASQSQLRAVIWSHLPCQRPLCAKQMLCETQRGVSSLMDVKTSLLGTGVVPVC